jgi:3-hydroxybutyryl-CoA dehydrogenase
MLSAPGTAIEEAIHMVDQNQKVVVVGAGLMGTGIAHAFASSGFDTRLVDTNADALMKAQKSVHGILDGGVKLGKLDAAVAESAKARLSTSTRLSEGAEGAHLLVETVSENLMVKKAVLAEAAPVLAANAVIATNTSALSVTEIATAVSSPERVIGMHFFNPVHKMKLVELVLGIATDEATVAASRDWCVAIGKTSILVNESPGLTTSRMSAMLGNEAMWMLQEGTASAEDIDTALRMGFNHPMGPLELGDLTGWDTRLSVLRYLHSTLGEKFRPCPLIIKMVAAGRYGRKTGHGVYKYDENGQRIAGSGLKASNL